MGGRSGVAVGGEGAVVGACAGAGVGWGSGCCEQAASVAASMTKRTTPIEARRRNWGIGLLLRSVDLRVNAEYRIA